eukprot:c12054_g1_i2.p1 GENE.c12054_g1_i2~~c12054_g1_i2.p1  ORF type:complete len:679 (+),score=144.18 c12054_g1_i2:146-2182(+)
MSIFCAHAPLDVRRILARTLGHKEIPKRGWIDTGSVIHVWEVSKTPQDAEVNITPLSLNPIGTIDENNSYIVLHTRGHVPTVEVSHTFTALSFLAASWHRWPKGLEATDNTGYEIYEWNGVKAKAEIKSAALGMSFQLNTSLSSIASRFQNNEHMHEFLLAESTLDPISLAVPGAQASEALLALANTNPLFSRISKLHPMKNPHSLPTRASFIGLGKTGSVSTLKLNVNKVPSRRVSNTTPIIEGAVVAATPRKAEFSQPAPIQRAEPAGRSERHASLKIDMSQILKGLSDDGVDQEQDRKQKKLEQYDKICSDISEGLFLGSNFVARDKHILKQHGITHILNTAGVVCPNYFPNNYTYKTFFLVDGQFEDIECVFYETIEFIQNALATPGNRVFVHCFQGVSRSATLVICYLMVANNWTYTQAYEHCRTQRPIVEPNTGFMIRTRMFEKRLQSGITLPLLYEICPHKPQDPTLVARIVTDPTKAARSMYLSLNSLSLHPDSSFVLHCPDGKLFVWIGSQSSPEAEAAAMAHAQRLIKYEHGLADVQVLHENDTVPEFWQHFEDKGKAACKGTAESRRSVIMPPSISLIDMLEGDSALNVKAAMLEWPSGEEIEMFDSDDLVDDAAFLIVEIESYSRRRCYFWVGAESELSRSPHAQTHIHTYTCTFVSIISTPCEQK